MNGMPVNPTAIGAVQVRKDHISLIVLKLGVQPTNSFVVQLHAVHFFAPDGDRSLKVAKNAAAFKALKN